MISINIAVGVVVKGSICTDKDELEMLIGCRISSALDHMVTLGGGDKHWALELEPREYVHNPAEDNRYPEYYLTGTGKYQIESYNLNVIIRSLEWLVTLGKEAGGLFIIYSYAADTFTSPDLIDIMIADIVKRTGQMHQKVNHSGVTEF